MRVISGSARGRRLKTPADYDIRPTTDNVKEAVFNILQFELEGRRVLDLFAGTGQLGIECLSRGAREAVFVDESRDAVRLIKENLKICGFEARVVNGNSLDCLSRLGSFDIIFVDPPYDANLYEKVLETVNSIDILNESGIIVCEARRERPMPEMRAPYSKRREYNYGSVKLCIYRRE